MMEGHAAERRHRMTIRRYESSAEADRHDGEFWASIPVAERLLYVWALSEQQWQLAGHPAYEPGLHRSVTRLHRR